MSGSDVLDDFVPLRHIDDDRGTVQVVIFTENVEANLKIIPACASNVRLLITD